MPAYMIFIRESPVVDAAAFAAYGAANRASAAALVERYGIKPLAVYGAAEALEGETPDGIILLEFPTADAARAWYDSPEYQAATPDRHRAAQYRAILFEGLPPR
ncbi:DUF1330 domain-containing protein [Sphingomonas sp. OK281]|uniref:DUF1330 domain-containing protein n=1 Tax=Sphingomonas sp. OK281 TaxID=1881067 RepID=UPI0008ED0523|nr:DUF1330 domain-containing protein [Sphingomonas sp. OK281]SFO35520.1 Uncharacterized conserved protein, DUF1330 family [Sphingomonas sp. OK281]